MIEGGQKGVRLNNTTFLYLGKALTPSCVSYMNDSQNILVGIPALKHKTSKHLENTVYGGDYYLIQAPKKRFSLLDIKRLIGMSFDSKDVRNFEKNVPFKLIDVGGKPTIEVTHNGQVSKILIIVETLKCTKARRGVITKISLQLHN